MIWGQIEATTLEKGGKTKNVKNQEGKKEKRIKKEKPECLPIEKMI